MQLDFLKTVNSLDLTTSDVQGFPIASVTEHETLFALAQACFLSAHPEETKARLLITPHASKSHLASQLSATQALTC